MQLRINFTPYAMKYTTFVHLIIFSVLLLGCSTNSDNRDDNTKGEEPTLSAENPFLLLLSSSQTGIDFRNTINETHENNITNNINMYNGGGLCIADINNDQLPDIYFISSNGKNRLYLNEGNLRFKDITDESGLASENGFETAVTAADVNADGYLDFYICRGGPQNDDFRRNQLFINNKNNTFSEKAKDYGIDDRSASTGANFFDYDLDGDLDLYVLNYPAESIWTNKIEATLGADNKYKPLNTNATFETALLFRLPVPAIRRKTNAKIGHKVNTGSATNIVLKATR